ncbi:MAG: hypothetical protein H7Z18_11570 [Methylophilaceae bacterium]|nr:hypothetical protein [Methylophilaceae bacterium]
MNESIQTLKLAVSLALAEDWAASHNIAQDYKGPIAYWLHAVLHKLEGDQGNSRYWYAKTDGKRFEDFDNTTLELKEILNQLS